MKNLEALSRNQAAILSESEARLKEYIDREKKEELAKHDTYKNNMKYSHQKIILTVISLCVLLPRAVLGAQFIASSSAKELHMGDQFEVSIVLDTQGENANAFGGTITYPAGLLEVKEIRTGNSLVNFWVDAPTSTPDGIVFSGITAGGYTGRSGSILSLVFSAINTGEGSIGMKSGQLLRNDGVGSPIPIYYF